jgi:TRAP-type C4-dicarboxylate transport system permease small subunit
MPIDFGFMYIIYPIMFLLIIGALIIQYFKNRRDR